MKKCLICLSLRKSLIIFNTTEWKNLEVNFLIDKHLWPMEYDITSAVCKKCWQKLLSFHKFFVDVQKSHKVLVFKNFKTVQSKEFQKVLKEIHNDKNVHNIEQLERELLETSSNDIIEATTDPLNEPQVVSEPIDDVDIEENPNQLENIDESLENETHDFENSSIDLDATFENKEGIKKSEDDLNGLDDNDNVEKNQYENTKNIDNSMEIEKNELEDSLIDLIESLDKNTPEDSLTQANKVIKPIEENKNKDTNLSKTNEISLEEKTNNDGDEENENDLENTFSESGSSWANDEFETESEDSSTELEKSKKTSKEIDINRLKITDSRKKEGKELSVLEDGENEHDTQDKNNKMDTTDIFIAKYLKMTCSICQTSFETFVKLSHHYQKEHNQPGYVICCNKKFTHRWTIHDHLKFHENPNHYQCSVCNRVYNSRTGLANHKANRHKDGALQKSNLKIKIDVNDKFINRLYKITCCLCNVPMKNFSELSIHFEKEHNENAYVICCDEKFFQRCHLYDHLVTHNNPNHFKCTECDKVFKNRSRLIRHMKLHKETDKYTCNICNKEFKRCGELTKHKATHLTEEEKKLECPQCGKKFGMKYQLKKHTRIVHERVNSSICEICGITYGSAHALNIHTLTKHLNKPPLVACDICGLKLSSSGVLSRHKKIRHPEGGHQEYTCEVCSKVSLGIYAHKWHVNLHNKKFECKICGKTFLKAHNLRNHMIVHTGGEAPYKCPWCPKTFNSHGNYSTHRKHKHYKEWLEAKRLKYVDGKLPFDEDEEK